MLLVNYTYRYYCSWPAKNSAPPSMVGAKNCSSIFLKATMNSRTVRVAFGLGMAGLLLLSPPTRAAAVRGWLSWRGPQQNGLSLEKNLPEKVDPKNPLWVADFPGQSAS